MIDQIDQRIIAQLAADARMSLKALGQHVGLSAPAVAERIQRLVERGVVTAFTITADTHLLGYPLQAIVRVRPMPGKLHLVQQLIAATAACIECDKVTGDDCYVMRIVVRSMTELDDVLEPIIEYAETNTAIVKSQPVLRRLPPCLITV